MSFLHNYLSALRLHLRHARSRAGAVIVRHRALVGITIAVAMIGTAVLAVHAVGFAREVLTGLPDREQLRQMGRMAQSTTLFDAADRPVFTISKEARIEVPLDRVSPRVLQAVIATEDQRFYQHSGIDPVRLVAAALNNLRLRRAAQGASTLTQQLARQSFLTPAKTLRRKVREIVLAKRIEQLFSKREILELYLNKVYFGDGLYGVEAASRGYFGKHASDLSLSEAALLAGLVKSPSTYAPTINLQRATARRNLVLQQMLEMKTITNADYAQAREDKVALYDGLQRNESWGQHFKEQARRELVARFGYQRVYEGGLRVYTTISPEMQRAAEAAVATTLQEIEKKRAAAAHGSAKTAKADTETPAAANPTPAAPLEAALVAIEPESGAVRAMVGGRDFAESSFNRAVQAHRQPGSAFKPLVYATALESGYTPATMIDNLDAPINTPQGDWVPEDEHWDGHPMTVRTALRISSNRAAAQVLQKVGIAKTVDYARKVGLSVPSVPSLALGSGEVTPLSLAAAYIPFADNGQSQKPTLIRRVEDRSGTVLFSASPASDQVLSPTTAFLMTQMMADVINAGTGYKARAMGFTLPAAGKTGTTNAFDDAWFVGYTPHLLAAVWVGFDQPQTILKNGFGGDLAVPLWARFMMSATQGADPDWYTPPAGVVSARVCRLSGQLATDGCEHVATVGKDGTFTVKSTVYTEYFVRGTEPIQPCPLHGGPTLYQRIVGIFDSPPPDAATGSSGTVAEPWAPSAPVPQQPAADAGPKSGKKGFWGKVFGFLKGKKDDKKKDRHKDEPGGPGGPVEKHP